MRLVAPLPLLCSFGSTALHRWFSPQSKASCSWLMMLSMQYAAAGSVLMLACAAQMLPDVMEVEVSPEGRWKPANSLYDWQDFRGDPLPPLSQVGSRFSLGLCCALPSRKASLQRLSCKQ